MGVYLSHIDMEIFEAIENAYLDACSIEIREKAEREDEERKHKAAKN